MQKPTELRAAVAKALDGVTSRAIVLDRTGSTNDEARAIARDGAPHLAVVVANEQEAGRGRLGRTWSARAGESLLASWVARPSLPVDAWPLLPLIAGVAVATAVRARARVPAVLKWPNDLLVGERKLAGILVEAEPPAFAVVGVGLNVSQTSFPEDLAATATSIAIEGGVRLDRADLLAASLRAFDAALASPAQTLARYRELSATIGRRVRVERATGDLLEGVAEAVGESGELVLATGSGMVAVAAGDVVHVR